MAHHKRDILFLVQESKKDSNVLTIEATVVTGFEYMAMEECVEKCKPSLICRQQGRILFNLSADNFNKVLTLRSVDNLFLVNDALGVIELSKDKEKDLELIKSLVHQVNWEETMVSWAKLVNFEGILFPEKNPQVSLLNEAILNVTPQEENDSVSNENRTCEEGDREANGNEVIINERLDPLSNSKNENEPQGEVLPEAIDNAPVLPREKPHRRNSSSSEDAYYSAEDEEVPVDSRKRTDIEDRLAMAMSQVKIEESHPNDNSTILKFRATCNRVGEHSFTSMDAAACFGGALQDKFNWTVNLNNFDLNVILNINKNSCYICSAITGKSLHRRNITHFGYTTLRSTLCYNMVRLAEPVSGEIIVDPLCGGGSISIEGALGFPGTFHICGDNDEQAMKRTTANVSHINRTQEQLLVGPVQWSARKLPLRDSSVDICVTDLPFGKRSGKKKDNLPLYTEVLREMGRICHSGTARAVLLTHDKKSLTKALSGPNSNYWRPVRTIGVNQGGLFSTVFLLLRTGRPFIP